MDKVVPYIIRINPRLFRNFSHGKIPLRLSSAFTIAFMINPHVALIAKSLQVFNCVIGLSLIFVMYFVRIFTAFFAFVTDLF